MKSETLEAFGHGRSHPTGCGWQRVVGRAGRDRSGQLHPAQGHPPAETGGTSWDAVEGVPRLCAPNKRAEAPRSAHTNPSLLVLLPNSILSHAGEAHESCSLGLASLQLPQGMDRAVPWPGCCLGAGCLWLCGSSKGSAMPCHLTQHSCDVHQLL